MCEYCKIAADKNLVLYEDDAVVAALSPKPAGLGHIIVIPREHHAIIEQVPDEVVSRLFVVANQMSLLLFSKLGAKGTNLIIKNGIAAGQQIAHVALNILARLDDDGLDFQWQPKDVAEGEMSSIEQRILEGLRKAVSPHTTEGQQGQAAPPGGESGGETILHDEENYLTRQLERRP